MKGLWHNYIHPRVKYHFIIQESSICTSSMPWVHFTSSNVCPWIPPKGKEDNIFCWFSHFQCSVLICGWKSLWEVVWRKKLLNCPSPLFVSNVKLNFKFAQHHPQHDFSADPIRSLIKCRSAKIHLCKMRGYLSLSWCGHVQCSMCIYYPWLIGQKGK